MTISEHTLIHAAWQLSELVLGSWCNWQLGYFRSGASKWVYSL